MKEEKYSPLVIVIGVVFIVGILVYFSNKNVTTSNQTGDTSNVTSNDSELKYTYSDCVADANYKYKNNLTAMCYPKGSPNCITSFAQANFFEEQRKVDLQACLPYEK